ncbi:MAG: hypothetical protein PHS41_07150 [Victivallaceae bacterium]|nr:hypothetical protein [Victivallaceae bacterium]
MKKIFFFLFFAALFPSLLRGYDDQFRQLVQKAVAQTQRYWQGDYFGEKPFAANATVYDGRNVHDFTMIYWSLLNAKLNNDSAARERALKHYQYTAKHFWDTEKKRFRTGYDFLSNTSISLAILLSLRDARELIPPETAADMREKVRSIAAYLPTYTTALTNNNDLRANNQDSFAAFALALASEELQDAKIRQAALEKFRAILAVTQQSFWMEGGVDCGYQSVGEAAFANAADLLWEDLSVAERGKVASLALNAPTANGFGIENARSTSWIARSPARAVAPGLLGRVPNPFLAHDAEMLFQEMVRTGFPSKWWLHDPASLSFFSGFYRHRAAIKAIGKRSERFASGSLACQIMERDEQRGYHSGMEKTYLTGTGGTTAIFGDYRRLHMDQQFKKFGAKTPPLTQNPGGLRYLAKDFQLYVAPEDTLGAPRIFSRDLRMAPQMYQRGCRPGAGVSEYFLTQVMPGLNEREPRMIHQSFAVVGDVLLALFYTPEATLADFSYQVPVPMARLTNRGTVSTVEQKPLTGNRNAFLDIHAFGTASAMPGRELWKPYFKNPLKVDGKDRKIPDLRLLSFAFDPKMASAALLFSPERNAKAVRFARTDTALEVRFTEGERQYLAVAALKPIAQLDLESIHVKNPEVGFWQVAAFERKEVILFAFRGTQAQLADVPLFRAEKPETFSGVRMKDGAWLATSSGTAWWSDFPGTAGRCLIEGKALRFPAVLSGANRVLIERGK